MTKDLNLTVYGLATHLGVETDCYLFASQSERIDSTLLRDADTDFGEGEITIELSTVPAVAAMIERNAALGKLVRDLAAELKHVANAMLQENETGLADEIGDAEAVAEEALLFLADTSPTPAAAKSDLEVKP